MRENSCLRDLRGNSWPSTIDSIAAAPIQHSRERATPPCRLSRRASARPISLRLG
ncbi:Uncharacterised protein [Enterobacter cloacae]|nr:Uncharacterised protein [Enterobacter cloacae]